MKINGIKLFLALGAALLLGFVCEIIAPETESRNRVSLAISFISIAGVLVPAMGIEYTNVQRGVNIKTFSWIMAVVMTVTNMVFSCFEYKIDLYVVIVLLLAVIGWSIIYGIYSAQSSKK